MTSNPVEIFFSYSHKDEQFRDECEKHLSMLKREGLIKPWHDRMITAGEEWKGQIDDNLNTANIVLLLVTANFLASDYCYDIEMTRAMERHERGEAYVVPIILTPVEGWNNSPFGKLQVLPKDAKPVTKWDNQDEAFVNVAQGIRKAIKLIPQKRKKSEQELTDSIYSNPKLVMPNKKIEIFISYSTSTDDTKLLDEIVSYLNSSLDGITIWHEGKILGGQSAKVEIGNNLNSAHIILLLISPNYQRDYNTKIEINLVRETQKDTTAIIIPVLLTKVHGWERLIFGNSKLEELNPLPTNRKFITDTRSWRNRNDAFCCLAEELEEVKKSIA
jgi:hypothetical protein